MSKTYLKRMLVTASVCAVTTALITINSGVACAQRSTTSTGVPKLASEVDPKIQTLRKRLHRLASAEQQKMLAAMPDSLLRSRFNGANRKMLKKQLNAWANVETARSTGAMAAVNRAGNKAQAQAAGIFRQTNANLKQALPDSMLLRRSASRLRQQLTKVADAQQQHLLKMLPDSALLGQFTGKGKAALKKQLQSWSDQKNRVLTQPVDTAQLTGAWRNARTAFDAHDLQQNMTSRLQAQGLLPHKPDTAQIAPLKAFNEKVKPAKQKFAEMERAFGSIKKNNNNLDLIALDELRYKPSPVSGLPLGEAGYSPAKFVNVIGIKGNIQAFGVPLNVDFSSAQLSKNGFRGLDRQLFKFDMDPTMYQAMLKNEVQHYYDLRKNVFGGQDLNAYTSKLLTSQLADQRQALSGSLALSKYLQDPATAGRLLLMDEQQASATLFKQLQQEAESNRNELQGLGKLADQAGADKLRLQALASIQASQDALNRLSGDELLANYVNDPFHKKAFSVMPVQQIGDKLMAVSEHQEKPGGEAPPKGLSFDRKVIDALAHEIVLKGIDPNYNYKDLMKGQSAAFKKDSAAVTLGDQAALLRQLGSKENLNAATTDVVEMQRKATDAAAALQALKTQLKSSGFDPARLMQLQQVLNNGTGTLSEPQSRYFQKAPTGFMQQMFSLFSGFKAGSFGSSIPGSTRNDDLFLSGTRVTFKSNNIPITLGYGGQNDIKSLKDDQFQNTIYQTPRNVAYFSAEMKGNRWGGPVKVSVLGLYNQQPANSLYSLPTVSSNNVAFTLSKDLSMGKLGNAVVDVSKTTTIYPNTFIASSEAILNQKAGVVGDPFYQSLSFGLTHHLDLESAGTVSDVYFNYAGMGYQNAGNNGFGGAQMKFGGKFKKTAYANRLIFELRSDFRNQPISYTADDHWQTIQLQFTTRYKFSNKVNMSLQYSDNSTSKRAGTESMSAYGLQKLQLDGSATYKIDKYYTNSHFTFGAQRISNGYLAQAGGRLLMLNYSQVLLMGERSLTATMFINKELSAYKLIGNMVNSDLTYQFPASRSFHLISGLTYLRNTGMVHQAGVKEGLQYSAGDFDIASTVDLRKNLMTPLYPDLYSAAQAEFSISYHFTR